MPRFEKLRITLARPAKAPLLEISGFEEPAVPRDEYLSAAFSVRREFQHSGKRFIFIPADAPPGFKAGFFGRKIKLKGRSENLTPTTHDSWDSELFAIDLAPDRQIAVMHDNPRVGAPKAVLESFFAYLRKLDGFRDYEPHVAYMGNKETYWSAVRKNLGKITQVSFVFLPPNALFSKERVADFIKEASNEGGSEHTKHTYENKDGKLNPESDLLAGSADVALEGGGEAEVKAGGRTVYSSKRAREIIDVASDEIPEPDEPENKLFALLTRLFGIRQ